MVTIQQAGCNALAAHLRTQLPDINIEERWPDHPKLQLPTITILMSAPRQDLPIDMNTVGKSVNGLSVSFKTQIAAIEQLLQIDIWAANQIQRDDILARLDIAFNMDVINNGIDHGLILPVLDTDTYWSDSFFDFWFESPEIDDAPYNTGVDEWRARFRGHLWAMLAVNRQTARQTVIKFKLQLNETDFVTSTT